MHRSDLNTALNFDEAEKLLQEMWEFTQEEKRLLVERTSLDEKLAELCSGMEWIRAQVTINQIEMDRCLEKMQIAFEGFESSVEIRDSTFNPQEVNKQI